jgi:hypothetical protein
MRFFLEIEQGLLTYKIETPPVFVFGNTARRVEVQLSKNGAPYFLDGVWTMYFAIRVPNTFSSAPLAALDAFTLQSGQESVYAGDLNLYTEEMQEAVAESLVRDVVIQFTLTTGDDDSQSSIGIPAVVQNYTGNPLSDAPTPIT